MSRIGKLPIPLPDGVSAVIEQGGAVVVRGPKGELRQEIGPDISVEQENGVILVKRASNQKRHRAMHGLYRSLLSNMVTGVTRGFQKDLEIVGVGSRAEVKNGVLELALGFSHLIVFVPPPEVTVTAEAGRRGQNPRITVKGIDKQMVGQVAAKIRALRPPEPYKGKGVRYVGEFVRRKAGKTAAR